MFGKNNKEWMAHAITNTNKGMVEEWHKVVELTTKLNELTTNGNASLLSAYLLELGQSSYFLSRARGCLDRALEELQKVEAEAVTSPK